MKIHTFLLAITLAGTTLSSGCTATSETPREVSCSREDVVAAAMETIRRTASGYTYSDYIYPPRKLDYRPFAAYTDQLAGIAILLDHMETTESGSSGPFRSGNPLRCQATLAIEIPAEVAEVMRRSQYQKMRVLDNGKGRFGGNRIYFEISRTRSMRLTTARSRQTSPASMARGRCMSSQHSRSVAAT